MKQVERNILIPIEYYESPISPDIKRIVHEFWNKGYVKVWLRIKETEVNRIFIIYNTEESKCGIKSDISFKDEELYREYDIYSRSLQIKGLNEEWEARITDITKGNKLTFQITINTPWNNEENIEKAQTEADKIIRSAKSKAYIERKKILERTEADCVDMRKKALEEINIEKDKLNRYSERLKNYLSVVASRNSTTREEELHDMLNFLTIYQNEDDVILYKDEESFRNKIKDIKKDISRYQRESKKDSCSFDMRIDWTDSSLRPEHMDFDSWQEWGTRLADYFDDVASLYVELLPKLGFRKSLPKVVDSYYGINELLKGYGLKLSESYFTLWEELLKTCSSLDLFRRNRKVQEREEKEAERERIKAEKEYEKAIRQAEKDEATARRKLEEAQKELENQKENEKKYNQLKEQIKKLGQALQDAIERGERAMSMAQQTKKGFVYIISNVNSFGENVYKIGLTRRLDPTERIDELSNASVPFPFQINAIIESDDAPALEAKLHRIFDEQKMNKRNWRKEFFKISLDDIQKVLDEEGIGSSIIKDYKIFDYKNML